MNKKTILACLALSGLLLAGCGGSDKKPSEPGDSSVAPTSSVGPTSSVAPTSSQTSVPPPSPSSSSVPVVVNKYTVTWKNEDGTVLETDTDVVEGSMPHFDKTTPSKDPTVDKVYSFSGWTPTLAPVVSDVIYTATFDESPRTYTITWKQDSETPLKTEQVAYGQLPAYTGATPVKESTVEYSYEFNGTWNPTPVEVVGDATYFANFDVNGRSYHVRFVNYDGSELLDAGNVAYTDLEATKNGYSGDTPLRPQTDQYTYVWDTDNKWSENIDSVNSIVTYTANFKATTRTYTINWYDGNGIFLKSSYNVPYGEMPVYDGETPTKNQTATVRYIFNETWTPALTSVTGNADYYANFDEAKALYSVRFQNSNFDILEIFDGEDCVEYDDPNAYKLFEGEPTCQDDDNLNFAFDGWIEQPLDEVNFVRTFRATYHPTSTKPEALSYTYVATPEPHYVVNGFVVDRNSSLLTVPSIYNDGENGEHPVTAIGDAAFNWDELEKVVLPASITDIEDTAFNGNNKLKTVEIAGNPNIGDGSFSNCPELATFTMSGIGEYTIGERAFFNDQKLVNINLGSGATSIGANAFVACQFESFPILNELVSIDYRAFQGCDKLTSFTLGNKVETVGSCVFSGCTSLSNFVIPDSVTSFGASARVVFENCGAMESITIGKGLTTFSSFISGNTTVGAYYVANGHETLQSIDGVIFNADGTQLIGFPNGRGGDYVVPSSVTSLASYCFSGSQSLNSISFLGNIIDIPSYAFGGCLAKTISLPATVESIGGYAFDNCAVESLELGAAVNYISTSAFIGCDNLATLTIDAGNTNYVAEDLVIYNLDKTTLFLAVPSKDDASFTTPSSVTYVAFNAFEGTHIGHVTIGDNVESLGQYVFRDAHCTKITIGDGVTVIPMETFKGADTLEIELTNNIEVILQDAFRETKITEFTMPAACVEIDSNVFYECEDFDYFHFNSQAQILLGDYLFYGSGLKEITIPSSVKEIGNGMFGDCDSLTELDLSNLGSEITAIPGYFATSCDNLETVKLSNYITVLEQRAFPYCPKLSSINLPSSLTEIGYEAFSNDALLVDITLPASLTRIGSRALYNVGATTIHYAGTQTQWLNETFKSNRGSSWLNFPALPDKMYLTTIDDGNLDLYYEANR